jgi:hypothetical protein
MKDLTENLSGYEYFSVSKNRRTDKEHVPKGLDVAAFEKWAVETWEIGV